MNECVDQAELEEGDLIAYIDGAASDKVQAHLARCPRCAALAETYHRTENLLRATLYRYSCPDPEQLALYQLNLLSPGERLVLARHVRECRHCRRELDELAREGDRPSLLERLRQAAGVVEAALLPVPRLSAAPLRGTAVGLQRYRAEGLDVHISIQTGRDRGARTLMGRLVPRDQTLLPTPGLEVWLIKDEDEDAYAAPVEAAGSFAFEGIEPGEYSLGLEWDGRAILVQGIEVA